MPGQIDLQQSIDTFLLSLTDADDQEIKLDQHTVSSIQERWPSAQKDLARWLHTYKVFMGYTTLAREAICQDILSFAWEAQRPARVCTTEEVFSQFQALERHISGAVSAPDAKPPRAVTSLCSKALWCCYPEDVPIYDANARVALGVLARLSGIASPQHSHPYFAFLEKWFAAYGAFRSYFDGDGMRERFGYPVRAFDRYLWYLGDTSFASRLVRNSA